MSGAVVTADTGTGAGDQVFVLVHGIGVSSRYFGRLIPQLARHGRVIAIDLPGFGRAPRPDRPYTIEDFAAVTARVLDDLGVARCVVVGHSMGTQIASCLAVSRPDLVARLVLVGPVMAPRDRGPLRAASRLLLDVLRESVGSNRIVIGDYLRCGPRWYLAVMPSMLAYRTEDDLPHIDVPVLVLRGGRDPIARSEWVRALVAAAPRGRHAEIRTAPHVVMHSSPVATARAVRG